MENKEEQGTTQGKPAEEKLPKTPIPTQPVTGSPALQCYIELTRQTQVDIILMRPNMMVEMEQEVNQSILRKQMTWEQ